MERERERETNVRVFRRRGRRLPLSRLQPAACTHVSTYVPGTPLSLKSYDYFKVHSQKLAGLLCVSQSLALQGDRSYGHPFRPACCRFPFSNVALERTSGPLTPDRRNLI